MLWTEARNREWGGGGKGKLAPWIDKEKGGLGESEKEPDDDDDDDAQGDEGHRGKAAWRPRIRRTIPGLV